MHSKIEGPGIHLKPVVPAAAGSSARDGSKVGAVHPADTARFTDQAVQVQTVANEVAASPDVDLRWVAEVREALLSGRYRIDAMAIADRLIGMERTLKPHD